MILIKRWTLLLLVPAAIFSSCNSDSNSADDLIGNWVSRFSFNGNARSEAVSFTIGSKTYVGLGIDDNQKRMNDFWEYDATTNLWRKVKTFPGDARSAAVAFSVNNKGYVGTGYNDNGDRLKDFYEFVPGATATDSGTWGRKADFFGTARMEATGFAIGTHGYLMTGYDGSNLKDFWEYTPTSDTWVEKPFPGNKRQSGVAFVIDNRAYFGTGINSGTLVNDFWQFDPAITDVTKQWTRERDIANVTDDSYDDEYTTITRSNGVAFVIGGKGYICSGESGGNVSACWEYTPDLNGPNKDTWLQKTAFEGLSRTGAIGFNLNGRGFLMTGRNGNTPYDDLWEFLPNADQVDND